MAKENSTNKKVSKQENLIKTTENKQSQIREEELDKKVDKSFTEVIYNTLTEAFASKNPTQLFSLCWPGTILDYNRMKWDKDEETGGNMPEYALIRSSLILDQYVAPSPITQPDGTKVSDRYKQVLNQLGPIPNERLIELQDIVRDRLDRTIITDINGEDKEIKLVDWFSYLNDKWIKAKRAWGNEQQKMMAQIKAENYGEKRWWNEYLVWYGLNAESWIDAINAAHDRLITEFPLTQWEDAIAILDTKDNAALNEAKRLMRNMSTPVPKQEGVNYIPTQGIPYTWPLQLKPSSKLIDLLADPMAQNMALENAISQIEIEIRSWMAILPQVNDAKMKEDLDAFNKAMNDYSGALKGLMSAYTENAVIAAKIIIELYLAKGTKMSSITNPEEQAGILNEVNKLGESLNKSNNKGFDALDWEKMVDDIGAGLEKVNEAQFALTDSGRSLAGAALTFLNSKGKTSNFKWLRGYIDQLNSKLNYLSQQLANSASASSIVGKYLADVDEETRAKGDPFIDKEFGKSSEPSKLDSPQELNWTKVNITITKKEISQNQSLNTYFSSTQWSVGLFLGSAGGSEELSGTEFADKYMEDDSTIEMAFLATKVMIDRPWMKPEIFQHTGNMFRTMKKPMSPDPQITQFDIRGSNNDQNLEKLLTDYSFPSYPVAMLLAKDVSIKVGVKQSETERLRSTSKSVKSNGGGFLFFSVSKSEATSSENESLNAYSMAGQFIVRAPAPQIIGYWSQFTPPDQSEVLSTQLAADIADALGFIGKVDAVHKEGAVKKENPPTKPTNI